MGGAVRHHPVQRSGQVGPHVGVGILVDAEGTRSVLHEQVEQSGLWQRLGQVFHDFARNQVAAPAPGRQVERGLLYHISFYR